MKFVLAGLALMAWAGPVSAETYYCSFTEPFLSFEFNTDNGDGRFSDDVMAHDEPDKAVLEISGANAVGNQTTIVVPIPQFSGKTEALQQYSGGTMTIRLNTKGSDGMSDYEYPFEAGLSMEGRSSIDLYGGCESTTQKKVCPEEGGC